MHTIKPAVAYCFEGFELQPEERCLLIGGAPTALGSRAFDLLLALVERRGQLVTKDALLERVWPDVVVEENNLQVQISTLRKLLGRDAIATVVGRGYRFTRELLVNTTDKPTFNRSLGITHTNVPHNLGALIGRANELAQLAKLIDAGRLVTITGPGGVGKTRLMNKCALDLAAYFDDGVWLIELATQIEPEMVAVSIATTLRIEVKDLASASEALARHVRDKHLLLLLDNCEHLVDAVASLVSALLLIAPALKIVTTSQDILGINGEQVFRVPSLTLPSEVSPTAADATTFGAVELFVERAMLGDINFCCDDQNAPVIATICRRLDGIPLAIEMAAARVATLGLADVARLLDERFLALTAGRRGAVPRQRTLQATLDWSFGLLAERERIVFRRLAGFVGGCSLAAAIAVATDSTLDQNDVVDAISVLVTKSLLTVDATQGQRRYRLLEIARAYALERLAESGESNEIRRRTAEHYVLVFGHCFDDWTRLSDAAFDARYAPDLDNLRLSLDWAFSALGDAQLGLELTGKSGHLWIGRLMIAESERRIATAFSHVDASTPPTLEAHLQLVAGIFFYWREWERSIAALEIAVPMFRALGESHAAGCALLSLANNFILAGTGDPATTLEAAKELLATTNRPRLATLLRKAFALYRHIEGKADESDAETRRALVQAREGGFEIIALTLEENLVDSMWLAGDLAGALTGARDVVEKCKRVKVAGKIGWNWVYGNLFGILVESGELAEAAEIGRVTMPYLREANTAWTRIDHYALYLAKAGHLAEAAMVHGWICDYFESKGISHQPNERRARIEVARALQARFGDTELTKLKAKGAQLSETEICNLAVM